MRRLNISGAYIIYYRVTEYVIFYIFQRYVFCVFSDNNSEFSLIIKTFYYIKMTAYIISVSRRFVYPFRKVNGFRSFASERLFVKFLRLLSMLRIVYAQAYNILHRAWYRRFYVYIINRNRIFSTYRLFIYFFHIIFFRFYYKFVNR